MAPNALRAIQPTQIQKRMPRRFLRSGRLWTAASSTSSLTKKLLTDDPRIDEAGQQIAGKVDQDDPNRDDEHDPLDDEIVTSSDRGEELVAKTGNGEQELDDEATREETA